MSPPAPPPRRTWKRVAWRLTRSLAFIYLGVTLGCSMLQEWILFPGATSQGQSFAIIAEAPDRELVKLTSSNGDTVYALFGKALNPDGSERADASGWPTLVVFYGNGMTLSDIIGLCHDWRKLGANVIGVEYPGYGMSSGKPGEKQFYAAAQATWEYLKSRGDIDMSKIIPTGISIGTGVATELAHTRPAAGLILLAPLTSIGDRASQLLPLLPGRLMVRHHFDNKKKIGDLKIPILMIHGEQDRTVPASMSAELEKRATQATVTRIVVQTDHNDLLELEAERIDREMGKMIEQISGQIPNDQTPRTNEFPMTKPE